MHQIYAEQALLPQGWVDGVCITIAGDGIIQEVASSVTSGGEAVAGPLLPGLPNLHSHAFQRSLAGLTEKAADQEDSFWTWRELMYRTVARLDPAQVEAIARWLYVEMLKSGYTSVAEFHYLHHQPSGRPYANPAEMAERVIAAADASGIALTLLPVYYAQGGFGGQPPTPQQRRFVHQEDAYLDLLQGLDARHGRSALTRLGVAFHSLRAVTPGAMQRILGAVDPTMPVHIHIAEQQREVDDCLAWSGQRPISWLYEHQQVSERWCLIHATHASHEELHRMAESNAVVGLCPTTEANLGDGIFPAEPFVKAHGHLGVGSDSHVSVSPVEELRWLEYGQRLLSERRNRLASRGESVGLSLYQSALEGGARALGQPVGAIAPGYRADLLVLDGDHPLLATAGDAVLDRWLFAGGDTMVRDVMVAGRWLVREGHHPGEAAAASAFVAALRGLQAD